MRKGMSVALGTIAAVALLVPGPARAGQDDAVVGMITLGIGKPSPVDCAVNSRGLAWSCYRKPYPGAVGNSFTVPWREGNRIGLLDLPDYVLVYAYPGTVAQKYQFWWD